MIGGHGNNIYQYDKGKIKADFSSNIAFNNHSDKIVEYLKNNLELIKNYPDPFCVNLRAKLALHHGVDDKNIVVVNGSVEAFYLVAHLLKREDDNCNTLILTPSFAEYEDSCAIYKHALNFENIDKFENIDFSIYKSVWLGTPNNPNGYRVKSSNIIAKCKEFKETTFVVDKAYNELSDTVEVENILPNNLIIINSLTKSFGIPGIRLGYLITSSKTVDKIDEIRPPWSVNSLSLSVGEYIIDNFANLELDRKLLIEESKYLQNEIAKLSSFEVLPSNCNFFLIKIVKDATVEELSEYLIEKHGILIRNASNFRSLNNKYFRIAAQNRDKNLKLIEALRLWR